MPRLSKQNWSPGHPTSLSRSMKKGYGPSAPSAPWPPGGPSSGLFPALLVPASFRCAHSGARKCARIWTTWMANSLDDPFSSTCCARARSRPAPEAGSDGDHLGVDRAISAGLAGDRHGLVLSQVGRAALHSLADAGASDVDLDVLARRAVVHSYGAVGRRHDLSRRGGRGEASGAGAGPG